MQESKKSKVKQSILTLLRETTGKYTDLLRQIRIVNIHYPGDQQASVGQASIGVLLYLPECRGDQCSVDRRKEN